MARGKSKVLKAISGPFSAERGRVANGTLLLDGEDLLGAGAPDRVRRGLVHVLEGRRVFAHPDVGRSLLAAARCTATATMRAP